MSDQQENTEQRQEEIASPQTANEPPQKKPICKLSILSAVSFLLIIPMFVLIPILGSFKGNSLAEKIIFPVCMIVMAFSVIVSPIIAVIAKIRIALSDGRLRGTWLANFIIIGSSVVLIGVGMPALGTVRPIAERVVCGANLKGLGTALVVYANEHDDRLPTASQWCDLLITHMDVSPKSFICPSSDDVHGECSYAMNRYAAGKKLSELPAGMVLVFETNIGRSDSERCSLKEREFLKVFPDLADKNPDKHKVRKRRWNQVGGPEDLMNAHNNGSNFMFADGHSSFEQFRYPDKSSGSDLETLYWDSVKTPFAISDYLSISEVYGEQIKPLIKIVITLAIVIAVTGLIVIYATQTWRYPLFVFILAVGASMVGFVFGSWGQALYFPEFYEGIGGYGGAGFGVWLGVCYVGILMKLKQRLTNNTSIRQLGVSLGMATGMICSTLVHLVLILIHRNPDGFGIMLAALPFGMVGGAVLGAISGWVICKFYRTQTIEPISKQER